MAERPLPEWFEADRWVPPPGSAEARRLALFMARHGIGDYQSFLARSVADPEWFYRSAFDDLGLEWPVGFRAVYEEDSGLPWSRWFVGGRTNLAYLALERWRSARTGGRIALVWEGDDGLPDEGHLKPGAVVAFGYRYTCQTRPAPVKAVLHRQP